MARPSASASTATAERVLPQAGLPVSRRATSGYSMWSTAPIRNLRTLYVYLCNGSVETIGLCTSMKLSDSELVVHVRDDVVRRFRRADVYLASWERVTPPVMF